MRKKIDMTGWKMWEHGVSQSLIEVIDENFTYKQEHNLEYKTDSFWNCKCKCGKEIIVQGRCLTNGNTKSCGCYKSQIIGNLKRINELGNKYGRLTVIQDGGSDLKGQRH